MTANTTPRPLIGAHMPTAGGVKNALTSGQAISCDVIQLFTSSPRQWKANPVADDIAVAFKKAREECGSEYVIAHDSYLINLAAPRGSEILAKSHDAFRAELERAEALGLDYVVSHPGAHGGDGEDVGLERLIESLDLIAEETSGFKVRVALETTAGQGNYLGNKFEHLARLLDGVKDPSRLCVCLDTCHIFAAGYDIRTAETFAETFDAFDRIVGISNLKVIHANDSLKPFSSHADRHAHIGEGLIGTEGFRLLMNDPRLTGIPLIVETPDSEIMHEFNVKRLRNLIGLESIPEDYVLATPEPAAA